MARPPLVSPDEGNAVLNGIMLREFDCPGSGMVEVVTIRFPFTLDMDARLGDEPGKVWVIGEGFAGLLQRIVDCQDEQGVPPGRTPAIEHDLLGVVGAEATGEIGPSTTQPLNPTPGATPPPIDRKCKNSGLSVDQVKHGMPP